MMSVWKVLLLVITVLISILLHYEVENDVLLVEKEVALPVSRAKAFLFLSDMKNLKIWFPGVDSFEPVDSAPMGIGKHFTEVYHVPLYGNIESDNVILAYESPKYISFFSDTWLMRRIEIELERSDNVPKFPTTLTWRMYSRRRSYLFYYMLSPAISYMCSCTARQALFSLRFALQEP